MKFLQTLFRNPWIILACLFVIIPSCLYLFLIHGPLNQVSRFRDLVTALGKEPAAPNLHLTPSSEPELEALDQTKQAHFTRIKKIDTRESLLQFNNVLADALALQARRHQLEIINVDMENALIAGSYVPQNEGALDSLRSIPSLKWNEIDDPLSVPLLKLPSIDIYITVSGKYSQVFSFLESLPAFPVQVLTSGLQMMDDYDGQCFRICIRGFYYDSGSIEHIAEVDTRPLREGSLF